MGLLKKFAVVGAGFSGSVMASELAKRGHKVVVYESRDHIAGNCYTERDCRTGILVHKYGPHIFHTDNERVWKYISAILNFKPFINRVKTTYQEQVFSLPINLHTINQLYNRCMSPDEAIQLIKDESSEIDEVVSFEDQALAFVGEKLYRAFLFGYTKKQWGMEPAKLPASILKRLPVRFNYDDNYFSHRFQGMPENGYTPFCEVLLGHENIELHLNTAFKRTDKSGYDHVFYTGPMDGWFDYELGRLGYRTLDFVEERHEGDFQGCAVMNYADEEVPFTRISEHKHFAPWEQHPDTIIYKEYSRACGETDIPYYPIRLVDDKELLSAYVEKVKSETDVSFLGRLATYRYLDMDVTISEALQAIEKIDECLEHGTPIPQFFTEVL